jgi:hypothetical protein
MQITAVQFQQLKEYLSGETIFRKQSHGYCADNLQ